MAKARTISEADLAAVDEGFASIEAAAKFLSLSRAKLYDLMNAGLLAYAKMGRSRRIPWSALKAFAAAAMVSAR